MLGRLAVEWNDRGPRGFCNWLCSLLVRRQSHVLYHLPLAALGPVAPVPGIRTVRIAADSLQEWHALATKLVAMNAQNRGYLDDVRRGAAIGVALLDGDDVVHYAFVFLRNKTACLLGLPGGCALIGNAYTVPGQRGRGLQAHSARERARVARDAGFDAIACETGPDNAASQRGLEKAGMRPIGPIELLVLLNCVVVRWRRPAGFAPFGFCR